MEHAQPPGKATPLKNVYIHEAIHKAIKKVQTEAGIPTLRQVCEQAAIDWLEKQPVTLLKAAGVDTQALRKIANLPVK